MLLSYMDVLKGKLAYDKKNPKTEPKTATGRGNTSVTLTLLIITEAVKLRQIVILMKVALLVK